MRKGSHKKRGKKPASQRDISWTSLNSRVLEKEISPPQNVSSSDSEAQDMREKSNEMEKIRKVNDKQALEKGQESDDDDDESHLKERDRDSCSDNEIASGCEESAEKRSETRVSVHRYDSRKKGHIKRNKGYQSRDPYTENSQRYCENQNAQVEVKEDCYFDDDDEEEEYVDKKFVKNHKRMQEDTVPNRQEMNQRIQRVPARKAQFSVDHAENRYVQANHSQSTIRSQTEEDIPRQNYADYPQKPMGRYHQRWPPEPEFGRPERHVKPALSHPQYDQTPDMERSHVSYRGRGTLSVYSDGEDFPTHLVSPRGRETRPSNRSVRADLRHHHDKYQDGSFSDMNEEWRHQNYPYEDYRSLPCDLNATNQEYEYRTHNSQDTFLQYGKPYGPVPSGHPRDAVRYPEYPRRSTYENHGCFEQKTPGNMEPRGSWCRMNRNPEQNEAWYPPRNLRQKASGNPGQNVTRYPRNLGQNESGYPLQESYDLNFERCNTYSVVNELTPDRLVDILVNEPSFSTSLLNLMEAYDFEPTSVRRFVSHYSSLFQMKGEIVTLMPKIDFCQSHLGPRGCLNRSSCGSIHICLRFVKNSCSDVYCVMGHDWHTNHNQNILRKMHIDHLNPSVITELVHSVSSVGKPQRQLEVCHDYNSGRHCNKRDCNSLHVCKSIVIGHGTCSKRRCSLNHSILSPECCHLLEAHGIATNESPRCVLKSLHDVNLSFAKKKVINKSNFSDCTEREKSYSNVRYSESDDHRRRQKTKFGVRSSEETSQSDHSDSTQDSDETSDSSGSTTSVDSSSQKNKSSDDINSDYSSKEEEGQITRDSATSRGKNKSKYSSRKMKEKSSLISDITQNRKSEKDNKKHRQKQPTFKQESTVWSHYLRGEVEILEICYDSVESMCNKESNACKRLHATQHFHWQVGNELKDWYNLLQFQVEALERSFCDVTADCTDLPRLDPATLPPANAHLLTLMGRDTWQADFVTMTLKNSKQTKTLHLRRLCSQITVGQTVKPNCFSWFFLDKNQKWVQYGHVDTTGEQRFVSNNTSDDIEKAFQKDPSTPFSFQNSEFIYTLDFSTMTQTNQSTHMQRAVRRRPAPHLKKEKNDAAQTPRATPPEWEDMPQGKRSHFVNIDPNSEEYQKIVTLLAGQINASKLVKIERIQNPFLWLAFQNKVQEMTTIYGDVSKVDVRQLFHGTRYNVVSNICNENFDWRLHGSSTGQAYGRGTYFATSASYSYGYCGPDTTGQKFMFVARVAVGSMTQGNNGMARPPTNPATNSPYDSTVDNTGNPSIIVKYDKQEYYPEYVLTMT